MKLEGGCHCGAVRYTVEGQPQHVALCHCGDCRKSSGAPTVAWAAFNSPDFTLTAGSPSVYNSSGTAMRHFCPTCGSGLYYVNEANLPGLVDIQVATLDDPDALPPQAQIQVAERIGWMKDIAGLHEFERYPG
ncbi:GFA family protein [Novosphingobium sp. BL-52-GroH]|uniref:GFA family protein n=1 Tax=Novosphingobium sp. BL-52-GroH TaxID=3349877 RepID=UPI003851646E